MSKNKLTVTLLQQAIEREKKYIAICKTGAQRNNPQVLEMRYQAEGRLETCQAVLDATRGNALTLKIIAGVA